MRLRQYRTLVGRAGPGHRPGPSRIGILVPSGGVRLRHDAAQTVTIDLRQCRDREGDCGASTLLFKGAGLHATDEDDGNVGIASLRRWNKRHAER
jgi:hypothetical protein